MRSKNVIYNVVTNLLLQLVVIIYGFVVPKIIISNYGSNVNGLISSITQFLAYIVLLDSGFTAVVKSQLYKPIAENNYDKINAILKSTDIFFKRIAYIFIAYVVVLSFIYPLLNNSFDYWFTSLLIITLSISLFSEYYFGMVYKIYLESEQKYYIISIIQIFIYLLVIISTIIISKFSVSIIILKLFSCSFFIIRPIILYLYVKKKYAINLKKSHEKYHIKNKWDGLAQHIASVIHSATDITVLTVFASLIEVSVYSVYALITSGIRKIIQSFISGIDASFGDMLAKDESDNLNKKFTAYEVLYNTISTIIYSCTLVLIIPFVTIYTKNFTDANYIRNTFACLIVISEYIWSLRQPYNELIKAAGRFKETKKSAWIECITNIIISIVLVIKYGLIGVAIGTIVSIAIRTFDLIYQANKYILKRSIWSTFKKLIILIIETIIIIYISKLTFVSNQIDYLSWIQSAIIVFCVACVITIIFNYMFFKKEYAQIIDLIKNVIRRRNAKKN